MPEAVSTPIRLRTCGASMKERRPVPQPISRTSRSGFYHQFLGNSRLISVFRFFLFHVFFWEDVFYNLYFGIFLKKG